MAMSSTAIQQNQITLTERPRPSLAFTSNSLTSTTAASSLSLFSASPAYDASNALTPSLAFVASKTGDIEKAAYEDAIKRLEEEFKGNSKKLAWLKQITSSADGSKAYNDLLATTREAEAKYSRERASKKSVSQFMSNLSARIMHYSKILDTLSNHHPEYVSLVWGLVKFVLMGFVEHGTMVDQFAEALAEIQEITLPIAKVNAELYKTDAMQNAMAKLYSQLLVFLLHAVKWYNKGSTGRAIKSVTSPFDLTIKEPIEKIRQCAVDIDKIANTSQRVDVRRIGYTVAEGFSQTRHDIHQGFDRSERDAQALLTSVNDMGGRLYNLESMMQSFVGYKLLTAAFEDDALHPQRIFNEHRAISTPRWAEVNLQQILATLEPAMMPGHALEKQQSVVRRFSPWRRRSPDDKDLYSELKNWAGGSGPPTLVLHAQPRAQESVRIIITAAVTALKDRGLPVIWYLADSTTDADTEPIEILKTLVLQAIELSPEHLVQAEPDNLNPEKLSDSHSRDEWLSLLVLILRRLETCFVVMEAEDVARKPGGPEVLQCLLDDLARRLEEHPPSIKLLLVSYTNDPPAVAGDPRRTTMRSIGRDLPVPPRLRRAGGKAAFEKNIRDSVTGETD